MHITLLEASKLVCIRLWLRQDVPVRRWKNASLYRQPPSVQHKGWGPSISWVSLPSFPVIRKLKDMSSHLTFSVTYCFPQKGRDPGLCEPLLWGVNIGLVWLWWPSLVGYVKTIESDTSGIWAHCIYKKLPMNTWWKPAVSWLGQRTVMTRTVYA